MGPDTGERDHVDGEDAGGKGDERERNIKRAKVREERRVDRKEIEKGERNWKKERRRVAGKEKEEDLLLKLEKVGMVFVLIQG